MAYTSEIEKLERRNAENPQGRLFAPLADAYRKQGEVARAMALLREGLERHPDYIGAQIVLGRCHLDLGEAPEASAAFQRVLDLDGENVIALKALADIADRGGRRDEAMARLERLLEIDRGNEEAAAQLEGLRARPDRGPGGEAALAAALPDAATESEAEPAPMAPPAGIELTAGFGAGVSGGGDEPEPPPVAELELMEAGAEMEDVEPVEGLEVAGIEGEDFFLEREIDIELEGSAENEFQSRSDAERLAAPEAAAPNPWQNLAAETVPPPPGPPTVLTWEEAEPAEAGEASEAAAAAELAAAEAVAVEPPTLEELGEVTVAEPAPEEPGGDGEPELVVTETMAAVYERQGLRREALTVYRELAARRPEDARLAAKVVELEAAGADVAPAPAAADVAAGQARGPVPGYAAADTGGEPLGGFLRGVLAARLAGPGAAPTPVSRPPFEEAGLDAAPTRPAADPVSLSAIFGDDLPPAAPAASHSMPSAGQGFSFDAFFGAGGAPAREGARPAATGEDDLEQFHAWLQGLKK